MPGVAQMVTRVVDWSQCQVEFTSPSFPLENKDKGKAIEVILAKKDNIRHQWS